MTKEEQKAVFDRLNRTLEGTGCTCACVTDHKVVLSDDDIGVIIFGLEELKTKLPSPERIASKVLDKYVEQLLMSGFNND